MRHRMLFAVVAGLLMAVAWSGVVIAEDGAIHRAQFTTDIQDREPVDEVTELGSDHDSVYFFMEVRDMEGMTLTHRYLHDGEVRAEVPLDIGGPRWRTWSNKRLSGDWQGSWTVEVVDSEGEVHGSWSFEYGEADEAADSADEAEEDEETEEDMEGA